MKMTEPQALSKMAAYCSKAERSAYDVRKKLEKWELEEENIQRIIERLKKENFLNEERFCRSFIKDKIRFNKWGQNKIVFELKKKRVPDSIVRECLSEIETEEFDSPLLKLLTSKAKTIKAENDYEKQMKLIRFALGRGYSLDLIRKNLKKMDMDYEDYPE